MSLNFSGQLYHAVHYGVRTSDHRIDFDQVASMARERWDTPTVFLTAYNDAETMRRARVTEPYGYLVKPFAEQELHATIEIALQQCGLKAARKQATNHLLVRTQEARCSNSW